MAPITISFSDRTATPPVFVAGSFTDWKAVELEVTTIQDAQGQPQFIYEKIFDLAPGDYQYKFRLGPGDWWVCDTQAPHTRDEAGNENNVLMVQPEVVKPAKPVLSNTNDAVVNGTSPKPEEPYMNGVSKAEHGHHPQFHQQTTLAQAPVNTDEQPSFKVNGIKATESRVAVPEPETIQPEEPVKKADSQQPALTEAAKEAIVPDLQPKIEQVVSQPVGKTVDGTSSPQPPAKEAVSKKSSDSSVAPKEKVPQKVEEDQGKVGCFSRFFLCGSSRK